MPRRHRIKNYPDWAESQFAVLCDEHGAVRNKSSQDRTGWDYIIEFEAKKVPGLPHDRQPAASSARVQVKSTRTGRRTTSLKLTNALRFCRHPEPCFIVLFVGSPDGRRHRLYAREFDEELIATVLRKAREADRDGIEHLNRVQLPVSFSDSDEHTDDLIGWMESISAGDPTNYATRKSAINETVGYSENRIAGSFKLPKSEVQALIDRSVGLPASFSIDHVQMHDHRFNIPARVPFFSGRPDIFEIEAIPQKAQLIFRSDGRFATFNGEFRAFDLPGLGEFRGTFSSQAVTAQIRGLKLNISYSLKGTARLPLDELANQVAFRIVRRGNMTVELSINGAKGPISLPVQMNAGGQDFDWEDWFDDVVTQLLKVKRPADHPKLSLDDLGLASNNVGIFAAATSERNLLAEATVETFPPGPFRPRLIAYYACLEIGDSTFSVIVTRPVVDQSIDGQRLTLQFGEPSILDRSARRGRSADHLLKLRAKFSKTVKRLGPNVVTFAGGDFFAASDGEGIFEISD